MSEASSEIPSRLRQAVVALLHDHPDGLSEFDLLKALDERGIEPFVDLDFNEPLALFRAHFILFHVLYALDERLAAEQGVALHISPLSIRMRPLNDAGGQAVGEHDPLRAYYGDLQNLHETGEEEVQRMLDRFWRGEYRRGRRQEALAELGLEDPVDDQTIRRAYRRLAMVHHPDRGGEHAKLQKINEAAGLLLGKRQSG